MDKRYDSRCHIKASAPPTTEPEKPTATPGVDLATSIAISPQLFDEANVYVHCHIRNQFQGLLVRIWKTTYLVDTGTLTRAKLIHAENVSFAPQWTMVPDGQDYTFLLIFESLPASCQRFDLMEAIAQAGGFYVAGIMRNQTDVYHVHVF